MGPRKKRLALLLVSVLVGLVLAEVLLRLQFKEERDRDRRSGHVRSDNPRLIYEPRPNAGRQFPGNLTPFRTNSAGFRDDEFVMPKPEGTYRIAVVGDSVTVGWEVAREHTYPQLMEAMLKDAGKRVDVMNLGVTGYNSIQEVEMLRVKGLAFAPDLAIVGYVLNDNLVKGQGPSGAFDKSFSRLLDRAKIGVRRLSHILGESVAEEAFRELAAIARKTNIAVLVVIFPTLEHDSEYPHHARHNEITELCGRHGFDVLDLLPAFREAGFRNLRIAEHDELHPNERGHRLAAREIVAHLRANPPKRSG
ncbi:MAG: SGNH/GDSL hydrolase family protein [Planctomycetota bacterium]